MHCRMRLLPTSRGKASFSFSVSDGRETNPKGVTFKGHQLLSQIGEKKKKKPQKEVTKEHLDHCGIARVC